MLTTESLLTSKAGFGLATATPAQRAICCIADGRPLGKLALLPDVVELVGGADALAALPSEHGEIVPELCILASIRSAKTMIACARAIVASQTVDVAGLKHGEVPRVSIVSLTLDAAHAGFSMLRETIRASAVLRPLLVGEPLSDSLILRHPSERPIEVACVAGAKAGGTLITRWSAGVIFDEAPRMSGAEDGIVNLDHARDALLGRLLPGAQALYIGSAWAPFGPVYDMVQEHWQRPSSGLVVLRGTGPMLNPAWWTPARCAALQARNPVAYTTDVMGEFADPESGLLSPIALRQSTREKPLELPPAYGGQYVAAVDMAEGAAHGNACTLVIVMIERSEDGVSRYRTALAREWRGVRPEQCLSEIASVCSSYGLHEAWTDQYAGAANADLARRYELDLRIEAWTAPTKLEAFTNLATLTHAGLLEHSPNPIYQRDLLSVKKRITQQGVTIILPHTGDGRHCDFAPALAQALKHAANGAYAGFDVQEFDLMQEYVRAAFPPPRFG